MALNDLPSRVPEAMTSEVLLRLLSKRWSLESWHWIRETQLREDDHRYRGNGAGVMAGFVSIREGLQAVMHDITALLAMATRLPQEKPA